MPKLIISGTTYELVDDLVTIGRGPDNAIVINNPSVSARHAQLQLAGATYRLKDLGSPHGTNAYRAPSTSSKRSKRDRKNKVRPPPILLTFLRSDAKDNRAIPFATEFL